MSKEYWNVMRQYDKNKLLEDLGICRRSAFSALRVFPMWNEISDEMQSQLAPHVLDKPRASINGGDRRE